MELWAGFECTLNRVGNQFRDQLLPAERSARMECLRALPSLGVRKFRYRLAWDDAATPADWAEADLELLRAQGIDPIAGLLHHGSGPPHTDLLSADFAEGLAIHAAQTARRFPWIEHWTPVNEPLTTARFSALYGHWYPHARSEALFWLALLNQVDATRQAMREIRKVNPAASLVQTEDLGRTYATGALADQAAFDNERRWMTWDLLLGRVVPGHAFHSRLCEFGFAGRLRRIADDPCPPDIIGVDHYLTSDRFLDHRTARYPAPVLGGNGQRAYADVEAVRVLAAAPGGIEGAMREASDRYAIPVALTECHNGCTREDQMRWLAEGWRSALLLEREGRPIAGVAAWAIMGARNWSSLAVEDRDDFECGAFDPRSGHARATGVANTMRALSRGRPLPPAALGAGWWQRPHRLRYPSEGFAQAAGKSPHSQQPACLLIAGATGTMGQALLRAAQTRGLWAVATTRAEMALDQPGSISAALDRYRPWGVINAAGWVKVDAAEADPVGCFASNMDGAVMLAKACAQRSIPSVHFSSDLVFDGRSADPYDEDARLSPLGVYGGCKAQADARLLALPGTLVIRTAAFFSPFDPHNFARALVHSLRSGETFRASGDHRVTPTFVPHLANAALDLLIDEEAGLWHVSSGEELSWLDFGQRIAEACGLDSTQIQAAKPQELGWIAARPVRSGLSSRRGQLLPSLDLAIAEFAQGI